MNTDLHFSSKTPEWGTPQAFYDELDREFNFTLDPCSTKENAKCTKFYTKEDDGLSKSWDGERVFCNPPYGRVMPKWVEKAAKATGGWWLCSSQHGQTQSTSTNTSTGRQKYGLFEVVSSSRAHRLAQGPHRSQAW